MANNARSFWHTIHIYRVGAPETLLAGLCATPDMTNFTFHAMIGITFVFDHSFTLRYESGLIVPRDNNVPQNGNYFIDTMGSLAINDENLLATFRPVAAGRRITEFPRTVRMRDGRCVITGEVSETGPASGLWHGFQAAHIFPLAHERHWEDEGYWHWITLPPRTDGTINSVQNGLLLTNTAHDLFDSYMISINPDVNISPVSLHLPLLTVSLGQLQSGTLFPWLASLWWPLSRCWLATTRQRTGRTTTSLALPPSSPHEHEALDGGYVWVVVCLVLGGCLFVDLVVG